RGLQHDVGCRADLEVLDERELERAARPDGPPRANAGFNRVLAELLERAIEKRRVPIDLRLQTELREWLPTAADHGDIGPVLGDETQAIGPSRVHGSDAVKV